MVIEFFMDWVQTAPTAKRVNAAIALARACVRKDLEPEKRDDVEAALTVLLDDSAASVRLAIAETLGAFSAAPRHIVTALANDNPDISIIVLSRSPVFHDAELVNFVMRGTEQDQIAISCRPWLSPDVVSAICEHGCKDAALGVLMNSAADFADHDLHHIAERHGVSTDIRLILCDREDLAAETRHVLLGKLSEALGGFVKEKSWMPEGRLDKVIGEAFDKASIIFAAKTRDDEMVSVVRNLMDQDRLTVSFLVRALCMGNISLVACAFSELSGVRFSRVEAILTNNRQSAFKAVYDRAGLPSSAFIVFQTALSTWRRLLTSGSKLNQARLPFIVTREVLDAYSGKTDSVIDELLILLRKLSAETARESSRAKAMEISERKHESAQDEQVEVESRDEASVDVEEVEVADAEEVEVADAEIIEMVVIDDAGSDTAAEDDTMDNIIDVEPVAVDADGSDAYAPMVKAA